MMTRTDVLWTVIGGGVISLVIAGLYGLKQVGGDRALEILGITVVVGLVFVMASVLVGLVLRACYEGIQERREARLKRIKDRLLGETARATDLL